MTDTKVDLAWTWMRVVIVALAGVSESTEACCIALTAVAVGDAVLPLMNCQMSL